MRSLVNYRITNSYNSFYKNVVLCSSSTGEINFIKTVMKKYSIELKIQQSKTKIMSRKIFYLFVAITIISYNQEKNEIDNSDYYRSKVDSVHSANIENNLVPMYDAKIKNT